MLISRRMRLARMCACVVLASIGIAGGSATAVHAALPDGRAYELVSPQDKNGGDVVADSSRTRASATGDALQFVSLSAFANPQGTAIASDYIAVRDRAAGTQGWATHAIAPPQEPLTLFDIIFGPLDPRYMGEMSPDLSKGVFLAKSSLATDSPNVDAISKLYVRDDLLSPGKGHYQLVSDCLSPPVGPCAAPFTGADGDPARQPALAGTSADFQHVIFESTFNLTNDATGTSPKLYEWDHGTLRLAGILPDSACGSPPCPAPSSAAGQGANPNGLFKQYTRNTISTDGSRIVFTSPVDDNSVGTDASNLYLRENHASSVQLNASERTAPGSPGPALFWAATPDLSKIYFTSDEQLTDEESGGLYAYDASLSDSDPHNLTLIASSVIGALAVSEHGDFVYFASPDQLIPGGPTACGPVFPCIFVWHDGMLHEVARINSDIERDTILGTSPWPDNSQRARITPDGTRMVFVSEGTPDEQPPYDHGSACQGAAGILPFLNANSPECTEGYLYDAIADNGAGKLTCVSCDPSATHTSATDADFNIRFSNGGRATHLNHAISDDGRFVFFDTGERLVPEDKNGDVYDVYEYDSLTGKVSLISGGTGKFSSFFLDAGANGRDVFFRTRDELVGWDRDNQMDLYDARIGGGFPDPVTPQACQGQGCQGPASAGPDLPTPGTATFRSHETHRGSSGHAAVFHAFALGDRKLARWAKTGVVELRVRVSDAGRLSARVHGKLGNRGRRTLASAAKRVSGGGTVGLRLRLSREALAALERNGHLRLAIRVAYSRAGAAETAHVTLIAP